MKHEIKNALTLAVTLLSLLFAGPGFALTLNEAQKLLASDGAAGDTFGRSVEVDGDTAVIGACRCPRPSCGPIHGPTSANTRRTRYSWAARNPPRSHARTAVRAKSPPVEHSRK